MALRRLFPSASTSVAQPFALHLSSRRAASSFTSSSSFRRDSGSDLPAYGLRSPTTDTSLAPHHFTPRALPRQQQAKAPSELDQPLARNRIYVTNLPFSLPNDMLGELFWKMTDVPPVSVLQPTRTRTRDKRKVRNVGFGFVEWEDEREGWDAARKAVKMSGKVEVEGRTLVIVPGKVPAPSQRTVPQQVEESQRAKGRKAALEEDEVDEDEDEKEEAEKERQ